MNANTAKHLLAQLDAAINAARALVPSAQYDDLSDLDGVQLQKVVTMERAAIERIAGRDSVYARRIEEIRATGDSLGRQMRNLIGVAESLRADLEAGYLLSVAEVIHGDLFGDFLEMARYLLQESFKDPAAVIAGASLEAHLRQLCSRNGISTVTGNASDVRPKKADTLNSDLVGASVYSKLDQKNVTAWLDIRNKAAHGRFGEYSKEQVSLLVAGIQDFITRNPA